MVYNKVLEDTEDSTDLEHGQVHMWSSTHPELHGRWGHNGEETVRDDGR